MAEIFKSACPLNCWDSCGLQVTVENGKATKIDGDPLHPLHWAKLAAVAVGWRQGRILLSGCSSH